MVKINRLLFHIGMTLLFFSLITGSGQARAEVMFEGYYKIMSGEKQVGYSVLRYEFDKDSKRFTSTSFTRTSPLAGDLAESLKAVATDDFKPVSYQYTGKAGSKVMTIDASFSKNVMTATVSDGQNPPRPITQKLEPGTFLSTFLQYLMLQKGYKAGKKFSYRAIAEEKASIFAGEAWIKEDVTHMGLQAYEVANKFNDSEFLSYVTGKGEVLSTNSSVQRISTVLVRSPREATEGMNLPKKSLERLFGSVPSGTKNTLAQSSQQSSLPNSKSSTPPPAPEADKQAKDK